MIITEILTKNAGEHSDETALIYRDPEKGLRSEINWKEFDSESNRLACALLARGIQKGDKVILLLMNNLEWLPAYFGILRTGALAVPINFRFNSDTLDYCNKKVQAKAMIFGEEFVDRINAIKTSLDKTISDYIFVGPEALQPDYAKSYKEFLGSGNEETPGIPLSIEDEAAVYFTSGTTGNPKGVLLTHGNLMAACEAEYHHHQQTHEDNFLCLPPLYHTGSKMHWFGNFFVGSKAVIQRGINPQWIFETVSEEKVTNVLLLVPWAHDILITIENKTIKLIDYDLDQWRLMHMGAQPIPPALIKRWKSHFPFQQFDVTYGLTEATGPGCIHLGMENTHKVGAVGKPGYHWQCRIVDNNATDLPPGEKGELLVKGLGVMKAYFHDPEETARTIIDGWLHTGDLAYRDEDGFIWLVDRKKDLVICGGENIYPIDVENFFLNFDKIRDIAVIGYPDERLGEVVAAVIEAKPGINLTKEEILEYASGLPKFQRPRKLFFGAVPRNPTGKIEKTKLREKYCQAHDY